MRSASTLQRCVALAGLLVLATPGASAEQAPATYVILDNDFAGPGGTDMQATLPLIADPAIAVLGFTVVTGDGWENDESARLLRFLEIAGRPDIPVVNGAVYPLMRTVAEMKLWETRYGKIPWKGAWGGLGPIDKVSPTQPPLPRLDEGMPGGAPASGTAAGFLIKQVHAHPHQVTIVAAGPLTNVALAIRLDPTFASDAKELIFMGGLLDTSMMSVTGDADFASDFNLIFDPEAAHIALTAPWSKITAVGSVSNGVVMDRALMDRVAAVQTPLTAYLNKYFTPLPLWDEMAAATAAEPSLVTRTVDAFMDVDVTGGPDYGHAHVWPDALAPKETGVRPVTIIQQIDTKRFVDGFVKAAQWTPAQAQQPTPPPAK